MFPLKRRVVSSRVMRNDQNTYKLMTIPRVTLRLYDPSTLLDTQALE